MLRKKHFIYKAIATILMTFVVALISINAVYATSIEEGNNSDIIDERRTPEGVLDEFKRSLTSLYAYYSEDTINKYLNTIAHPVITSENIAQHKNNSNEENMADGALNATTGVVKTVGDVALKITGNDDKAEGFNALVDSVRDSMDYLTGDENNDYPIMMLQTIYKSSYTIIDELKNSELYNSFVHSNTFGGLNTYDAFTKLRNLIVLISSFLVILIAISNYFKNVQQGKEPLDCVYQILIEIGLVGIFMANLSHIMDFIFKLGKEILDTISSVSLAVQELDPETEAPKLLKIITGAETGHFFWNVQAIIELAIPFLFSYILKIILQVQFLAICIEVFIRRFFTPLAVADIYHEGFRSPGARYLKKYFGCYLKLACFFLILILLDKVLGSHIGDYFNGATLTDLFSGMGKYMAINVAAIMAIGKTSEIINDVLGV